MPVGGVRCSHHNGAREDRRGLPRGHARLTGAEPRGTRPPVDLQKREYGAGGPAWVPYKPQNRAWGHRRGNVDRVVVVFSSVPRSGASRGRNAPFLGSRIYEIPFLGSCTFKLSLFLALNIRIASHARSCRPSSHASEPRRCPLTSSGPRCKDTGEWVDPRRRLRSSRSIIYRAVSSYFPGTPQAFPEW